MHTKVVYVTFLPVRMLSFLMRKMVTMPSMRSCLGRLLPMPSGSMRPNSLAVPHSQMGESGPFRTFWSDGCLPVLPGVVIMAMM